MRLTLMWLGLSIGLIDLMYKSGNNANGKTPLHDTARQGSIVKDRSIGTATIVLEYGANPTIKDNYGRTPLPSSLLVS
jgi:ankyrin repeat protein